MVRNASNASRKPLWSSILPGRLRIERGTFADYRALEHFHYASGGPRVPVAVWRAVYEQRARGGSGGVGGGAGRVGSGGWGVGGERAARDASSSLPTPHAPLPTRPPRARPPARTVAVGVLVYPTPASRARERALGLGGPRYGPKLAFVNAHVRTIARVIVHPQFRGLGVAAQLVRRICCECPTRYVEAFAAMGDVHPFFEQAGMTRVPRAIAATADAADDGEAAYFIFDRQARGRGRKGDQTGTCASPVVSKISRPR